MNRPAHRQLRDILGSLPAHDLPPGRSRESLAEATRVLGEGARREGRHEGLARRWTHKLEPAILTAVSAGWLVWLALQMAVLAR